MLSVGRMASSIITIPVTPLILTLYNECKENLKYENKTNTDFLIFLLNSSMHIYSIVKEFSPILQDSLQDEDGTISPVSESGGCSEVNEEPPRRSTITDDDETLIVNMPSEPTEPASNLSPDPKTVISKHFEHYSRPSLSNTTTGFVHKKYQYRCPKCSADFSFKHSLNRHIKNNACHYRRKSKHGIAQLKANLVKSTKGEEKNKDYVSSESVGNIVSGNISSYTCAMCDKTFANSGNLKRHMRLVKHPPFDVISQCKENVPEPSNNPILPATEANALALTLPATLPAAKETLSAIWLRESNAMLASLGKDTTGKRIQLGKDTTNDAMSPTTSPAPKDASPITLAAQKEATLPKVVSTENNSLPENPLSNDSRTHACSFCSSRFASKTTLTVHTKKFRCPRRCKFCDYSASRIQSIQNHLKREHNMSMSLYDIEQYNQKMFIEHSSGQGLGDVTERLKLNESAVNQTDKPNHRCPVYDCTFACNQLSSVATHTRHHIARIVKEGATTCTCQPCGMFGIPANKFTCHECDKDCPLIYTGYKSFLDKQNDKETKSPTTADNTNGKERNAKPSEVTPEGANTADVDSNNMSNGESPIPATGVAEETKTHQCKYCEFIGATGKSLGGHMKKHYQENPNNHGNGKDDKVDENASKNIETVSDKEDSSVLCSKDTAAGADKKEESTNGGSATTGKDVPTAKNTGTRKVTIKIKKNYVVGSKKRPVSLKVKSEQANVSPIVLGTKRSSDEANKSLYQCKFCEFTGTSGKSLGGHMNRHKFKQPRIEPGA